MDAIASVGDLGAAILAQVPEAFRAQVQPFIPAIVEAIHEAISIATASTFYIGIGAALIAAAFVLMLKEVPIRQEMPAGGAAVGEVRPRRRGRSANPAPKPRVQSAFTLPGGPAPADRRASACPGR